MCLIYSPCEKLTTGGGDRRSKTRHASSCEKVDDRGGAKSWRPGGDRRSKTRHASSCEKVDDRGGEKLTTGGGIDEVRRGMPRLAKKLTTGGGEKLTTGGLKVDRGDRRSKTRHASSCLVLRIKTRRVPRLASYWLRACQNPLSAEWRADNPGPSTPADRGLLGRPCLSMTN